MNRRGILRIVAVLLLVLIGFWLYDMGRAHTFLPENKTIEIDGSEYKAYASISFSINGGEGEELYPRDRVKVEAAGRVHRISVTGISRSGEEVSVKKRFRVSHGSDMYLLSLPALLGGEEDWIQDFVPLSR